MSKQYEVNLMLDSGIFSAWNHGETLDLQVYIDYVKQHEKFLFSHVNMDVIPGKFGQKRTQSEVELSAKQSYANLQVMRKAGLRPIPVFHQGESFTWLERMLSDGEDYIGISTAKDLWDQEQRVWLDTIFTVLTDALGRPLIKTHGFGITKPGLILRYPWFSVDSTTWSLSPGYGQILIPVYVGGKPNYSQPPKRVVMSGVQHKTSSNQKRQFEALGPALQNCVLDFLHNEVGITVTEARYGTNSRRRAVLTYYMKMNEHLKDIRFKHRHDNIFSDLKIKPPKKKGVEQTKLNIMYATSLNRQWSMLMNELGVHNRLLSYYALKDCPEDTLPTYVQNGIIGAYSEQETPAQNWSETYNNFRRLKLVERLGTDEDIR